MVWLLRYEHVWQLMSPYAFDGGCNHERGLSFFWILWLNRSSMKNQRPPPMSGLSLLSYPSSRLLRMCVTSLSYTLGVSTHVLLDTSSSSSVWKELQGERRKKMHAINYCFQRESRHRLQWDLLFLFFFFTQKYVEMRDRRRVLWSARFKVRRWTHHHTTEDTLKSMWLISSSHSVSIISGDTKLYQTISG